MKTKQLIILIVFILAANIGYSQSQKFTYSYDAAGNRILRVITKSMGSPVISQTDSISFNTEIDENDEVEDKTDGDIFKGDTFPIKVYPNPTYGNLTIEHPDYTIGEEVQLMLVSETGNIVLNKQYKENIQSFDIFTVRSGVYILRITKNGLVVTRRIIKQ